MAMVAVAITAAPRRNKKENEMIATKKKTKTEALYLKTSFTLVTGQKILMDALLLAARMHCRDTCEKLM